MKRGVATLPEEEKDVRDDLEKGAEGSKGVKDLGANLKADEEEGVEVDAAATLVKRWELTRLR